jgi:hypothetical protein
MWEWFLVSKQCAAALILHARNALSNRSQFWSITRAWAFCIDCAAKRVTVATLGNMYVVGPMWMTLQGSPWLLHARNTGR